MTKKKLFDEDSIFVLFEEVLKLMRQQVLHAIEVIRFRVMLVLLCGGHAEVIVAQLIMATNIFAM